MTIERALSLNISGNIFIITLKDQLPSVLDECLKIEEGRDKIIVLPEPTARNTAPAISIAAAYLKLIGKEKDTVLVLTSDHLITPVQKFAADVEKASKFSENGYLVTFGIPPLRPETGFGYIEAGDRFLSGFIVNSFREKPDLKTAESFLDSGNFFWNSGMFSFRVNFFYEQLSLYSNSIVQVFDKISSVSGSSTTKGIRIIFDSDEIKTLYQEFPSISIDYAVMEKCTKTAMVKASFDWNDIGSWDEMARINPESNITDLGVESDGNYILSDLPVALCGVKNLIVVVKNGSVLICKKGYSQGVKEIVTKIKDSNLDNLL